jgi:CRP-like cAMP-binding protein
VDVVDKMLRIKALPIFEGLTTRQLMDLARVVKEQSLPENTVVVHQGEFDDCLYLVVDGVIHILRGERLLAEAGPGDFFGEIALFEGTARSATAITRSRARLLSLERADLMRIIEEMPGIAISLLQSLSRRVRELTDRLTV